MASGGDNNATSSSSSSNKGMTSVWTLREDDFAKFLSYPSSAKGKDEQEEEEEQKEHNDTDNDASDEDFETLEQEDESLYEEDDYELEDDEDLFDDVKNELRDKQTDEEGEEDEEDEEESEEDKDYGHFESRNRTDEKRRMPRVPSFNILESDLGFVHFRLLKSYDEPVWVTLLTRSQRSRGHRYNGDLEEEKRSRSNVSRSC